MNLWFSTVVDQATNAIIDEAPVAISITCVDTGGFRCPEGSIIKIRLKIKSSFFANQ